MSKRIIGTVLFCTVFVIIAAASVLYFQKDTKTPPEEQPGTEFVEMLPTETDPNLVAAEKGEAAEDTAETYEYQFLLVNSDNYVAVYSVPDKEIYEYTDVIMDVLPPELQEEIDAGKYLKNEEELYNFLENYTS